MDRPQIRKLYQKANTLRDKYRATLHGKLKELNKQIEMCRPVAIARKVPIVDEPPRNPEKCHWDYLLAEVMWLQSDIASERKWKQTQLKKLGKEVLKHKYIVDRESGIDLTEQNLKKVSQTLAMEVEKFWKGINQLAHHRFNKLQESMKREENQKRLDELVHKTEKIVNKTDDVQEELDGLMADVDRPVEEVVAEYKGEDLPPTPPSDTVMEVSKNEKNALLDQISSELTAAQPTGNSFATANVTLPVPPLLRANMREYQHIGMQWLATLHDRGLNGILADEMGLGKTLQTIALLAHLACEKGIWGPHLIVVPTSVMVNWEIEFKKFLPGFKVMVYFGTPKERRAKRVGWRDDNVFNVCICSYALVLQDALVFRKKNWHYLILDEAHHIKNFKSLRWQNLLTFKTTRRLLLTGTPLQNDLIELWSLLHFLMPHIFTSHLEFQEWFSDPLNKAIELSKLDEHSKLISRLHSLIRPFLLRRLKRDVETQMPSKYEHVLPVALSRRQKVLYDEFLSHRETRQLLTLSKSKGKPADYLGLMNVLMQLRKICNHPDLLEARQVRSPFVQSLRDVDLDSYPRILNLQLDAHPYLRSTCVEKGPLGSSSISALSVVHHEASRSRYQVRRACELIPLIKELDSGELTATVSMAPDRRPLIEQFNEMKKSASSTSSYFENDFIAKFNEELQLLRETERAQRYPFGRFLKIDNLFDFRVPTIGIDGIVACRSAFSGYNERMRLLPKGLVMTAPDRLDTYWPQISQFMAYTPPVVVSPWGTPTDSNEDPLFFARNIGVSYYGLRLVPGYNSAVHRVESDRLCRFPDRRFLIWDCGKFKLLKILLSKLRTEGHKVILFTQMSRMLDVIEAFANLCGFTYVRLDGSTKVTDRQYIVDRFNRDKKLFLFISSTRAGGVGINLTGADTVVFFDSDWNPAMDKQAMDRCHRIGQVRDVNIYRLISESTIEENIFAKQLQKRKLDEVVIDRGRFGTSTPPGDEDTSKSAGTVTRGIEDLLDGLFQQFSGAPPRNRDIYGTHVLWERPEEDLSKKSTEQDLERMLAQVEDGEDVTALTTVKKEQSALVSDEAEREVETGPSAESLHNQNEDPNYLALPEIVRHSVTLIESALLRDEEQRRAAENDESEWEELENAQWSSETDESDDSEQEMVESRLAKRQRRIT